MAMTIVRDSFLRGTAVCYMLLCPFSEEIYHILYKGTAKQT